MTEKNKNEQMKEEMCFAIHSMCCMSHWEMIATKEGDIFLICEKCGKDSGLGQIGEVSKDKMKCGICGKDAENELNEETAGKKT